MNNRSYICRVAAQDPPKPQFAPLVPEGPPMLLSPQLAPKLALGRREPVEGAWPSDLDLTSAG